MLHRSLQHLRQFPRQPAPLVSALLRAPPLAPAPSGARWATSKGGGSTSNGRDSKPKMLGVKIYGGAWAEPGNIIVRQRGARVGVVESTATVALGRDHTIFALVPGYVKFWHHALRRKNYVEIVRSPPGVEPVEKYAISHVRPWELPALDRLFQAAAADGRAPPSVSASVLASLEAHRAEVALKRPSGGRGPASFFAKQQQREAERGAASEQTA